MIAWVIWLSSYVHTHTFTSERHVFESKAPEPSYSRGPEGRWRWADPQVPQPSTKKSRNFFAVNEPTITFCLQFPLRFTIGLAGSPLSSPSHVPLQGSHPPVPLAIDHGPPQLPAHAGHGSLPSRFLSFMFDLCHCGRVHLESYRLDTQLTEIFLVLTPHGNHLWPWVPHRHFTLVLHSSVLWDFTHRAPRSSSSLPLPLQIRSLFIRLCSLPVPLPQGYLTSDHCLIQSFRVPAKAGNFTSLDICLGSSLILPILNLP